MAAPADLATGRVLEVADLHVQFGSASAVRGVSFHIDDGETVALVGESGSGKSAIALSILQLLPYPFAAHPRGSIRLAGTEMVGAPAAVLQRQRGRVASMIFQEPMTSLNPLHTIERQIAETLKVHRGLDRAAARARVLELLELVRLPDPLARLGAFPHQLSGGQRQRVMIAMALACEPRLLIADEPTTALDVTIQKGILELLAELQQRLGMALLLISHDLGVVRAMADRVAVMKDGEIVEMAPARQIFSAPVHAYTRHLLASEPAGSPPVPSATAAPLPWFRGDSTRRMRSACVAARRRSTSRDPSVEPSSTQISSNHASRSSTKPKTRRIDSSTRWRSL